ncbi:MAG: hypothetical protein N4A44_03755 [Alphaproteobacteria bacterium]|nr:hypothetical protein [Alphaproteobacteria bacterium]
MNERQSVVKEKFIERFGLKISNRENSWITILKEANVISFKFMFHALLKMYSDNNDLESDELMDEVANTKEYNGLICVLYKYFYDEDFYDGCFVGMEFSVRFDSNARCYFARVRDNKKIIHNYPYEAIVINEDRIIVVELIY